MHVVSFSRREKRKKKRENTMMRQYWKLHHPFLTYATLIHIDKVAAQNVKFRIICELFLCIYFGDRRARNSHRF